MYAAGTGDIREPTIRQATSQEASSRVIGIGESAAINWGNDGDVHPMPIAPANIFNVAIKADNKSIWV